MTLILLALPTFAAGIYKWTDEKGIVHYDDQAPDDKTKKKLVQKEANPDAARFSEGFSVGCMRTTSVKKISTERAGPYCACLDGVMQRGMSNAERNEVIIGLARGESFESFPQVQRNIKQMLICAEQNGVGSTK